MNGLRVIPTWRHGQERLYVCRTDGRNVAWYERESSRVSLLSEDHREAVLRALAPFLTGGFSIGPPPVPTPAELARLALHPDDDLAPNRPGETLLIALDRDPAPARRLRADPRQRALAAEESIGAVLDGLESAGWHTLHSVPLPGGARLHHLLIGPGGLFGVHALWARKQRVRVADPMVTVGRADPRPLLRELRAAADRASFALTAEIRPVLALSGASGLDVSALPRGVRIVRDGEVAAVAGAGGVLKPADVEALHAMARDRRTWLRV